jgi:DNA-binding PadR family transcriptional regulator
MFNGRRDMFGNWFDRGCNFDGFGPHFERGDIKLVILNLLREKPRHGYDIIQEIEKKFHGFYSPSSGTIYPTLQLLEDRDMVTSTQKDGKKIYTITDEGLKFLSEHEDELKRMKERVHGHWGEHGDFIHEVREEMSQTVRFVFLKVSQGKLNTEKKEKLHTAFTKFREEVEKIVSED